MKIAWTDGEAALLSNMNLPFDHGVQLSDSQIEDLYDTAPDFLEFSQGGIPTATCLVVENIITKLTEVMRQRGLLAQP